MLDQPKELIEKHIKTHTERSAEDEAAVATLRFFLRSKGRVNPLFASGDKWPNIDGTFEYVPDPDVSRRPKQTFFVQIKGTHSYKEDDGKIKYTLQSLGFPATIAAGTGKTTLINYISSLMPKSKKLFLTKTHNAIQHLRRRIENPGNNSDFISFDSFTKKVELPDYDIIFVDECSIIDNFTMLKFVNKISENSLIVLAGDINQIESIDFGNWFYYAKHIITTHGANIELLDTWRTKEESLLSLWEEVRNNDVRITEKLVIDGPFSKEIGSDIFTSNVTDEVVLCLNYDGKFGLNNINSYFQNANPNGEAIIWQGWRFKKGDKILFNDNSRFTYLYNNLKGIIVDIEKTDDQIAFTIDVETIITEQQCKSDQIEYIDTIGERTRIKLIVYAFDEDEIENEEDAKKTIIPFQLAYAVSIHKAQGLEYDSVKVIIPSVNSEKITKGVFYTAITRTKRKLTIYWSSETMQKIISDFSSEHSGFKSLDIIKNKLAQL